MSCTNNRLSIARPMNLTGLTAPWMACSVARRMVRTYTGPLIRIRRNSDNAETDIYQRAGTLDTAAMRAFVGAGDADCTVVYDQSGNGFHLAETVAASQPPCYDNGVLNRKGFPIVQVGTPFERLRVNTGSTADNGFYALATYINAASADNNGRCLVSGYGAGDEGDRSLMAFTSNNLWAINGYDALDTGVDYVPAATNILGMNVQTNTTITVWDNGVSNSYVDDKASLSGITLGAGGSLGLGTYFVNSVHEFFMYNSSLTSELQQRILNNMNAFYRVY